jgi:hypothetical protein
MKYILSPNPNPPNNLRRICPPYGSVSPVFDTEDAMIAHTVARWQETGYIIGDNYHIVDEADLPGGAVTEDNDEAEFFDAWEWDGAAKVNMPKARLIHMDRIRAARNAELAAKDITFMRAVESGDTSAQATIVTEKQVLRDLPATFSLSGKNTSSTLHAAWPTELPARA